MFKFHEIEKLHVELSSACNAACPVCPRNVQGGYDTPNIQVSTFTYDNFVKIFDSVFIQNLKQILFVGRYGDPAYCKDFVNILSYIYKHNKKVISVMHTNGGIRSPDWWDELSKFQNLTVVFSIDGLEDTNHIYRRNVNWDKLINNVTSFISSGGNAIWEFLVFDHNQHQIDTAKDISSKLGFNEFKLKRPYGFNTIVNNIDAINVIDKKGIFDYAIFPADGIKNLPFESKNFKHIGHDFTKQQYMSRQKNVAAASIVDEKFDNIEIDCHAVKQKEIYVDALYNVHPCCWLAYSGQSNILPDAAEVKYNEWIKKEIGIYKINALSYSLRDILESSYFNKLKQTWSLSHKDGRFPTCTTMCGKSTNLRQQLIVEQHD